MKTSIFLGLMSLNIIEFTNAGAVSIKADLASRGMNVKPRALPDAPSGYAPVHVTCPSSRPTIRPASALSSNETAWLQTRRQKTESALKDFFGHIEIENFDAVSYITNHSGSDLPNVAIGISGGGLVACLNGGGVIKAFDERTEGSTAKGQLGGLLQSATYFAALSGGSWALGSIYVNNFTTVSNLQENLWDFNSEEIIYGPAKISHVEFWGNISADVKSKREAGFKTGDADFWGRIQGYNFFNASDGGVDYTWSSIAKTQSFQSGDIPMPLVVMTGNQKSTETLSSSPATYPIFETTPWEWGTYDDDIYGFAPLEYLGTRFVNGVVPDNETCVRGFDNAGFITGSSSDIWNENGHDILYYLEYILEQYEAAAPNSTTTAFLKSAVEDFDNAASSTNSSIDGPAAYDPNPFYQYNTATSPYAQTTNLIVQDGGETSQNVPLYPLIQQKRNVDVIFAVDSLGSSSYDNWPTGSSLIATYNRTLLDVANDTSFPEIPDLDTFLNLGLNARPTFFGCNASRLTTPTPLVVYLPNHPITYSSNFSLEEGQFNNTQRDAIITNGYNVATQANGTLDADWSTCVGCAVLSRSFNRTGTAVPEACTKCFQRYCWNGTVDDQTPAAYQPTASLSAVGPANATSSSTAYSMGVSLRAGVGSAVAVVGVIAFVLV
ncbi:lysophospholipase 1 [Aspergillus brunneoviolaceus CBS 621.78]|uniref:Lysophospholipase 1 n=1 Tax=Aspergillus brunneoviolaceus CBS 621.78 TaxID=1450534 RepID=A0ACD1GKG7_9EURO|nr:lysophospholipase 1 [Aspergillus brunneoviolaceus CBS 621.78]RAH49576.1 lysophospholipase 1 [Aspergillus brunneoviolaceus CBS 621.78]